VTDIDRLTEALALSISVPPYEPDWDIYLALADALEEAGRDMEARCYRWMHRNGKRPVTFDHGRSYKWYQDFSIGGTTLDPKSDLPRPAINTMRKGPILRFNDPRDAYADVAKAWTAEDEEWKLNREGI